MYGKSFYISYSVSNLLQSSFNTSVNPNFPNIESRIYYGMAAYRFNIVNKDWKFEPSLLIRKIENQPALNDFTTRIFYLENTWTGVTYRDVGTLVFAFGFGHGNMHFSYSYDHTFTGEITQYNYGTHEFGISFRIETLATQRHVGFWDY